MQYRKLMPWARKLTVLSVLIALIATVYVSGAATPQEAVASSHVQYVYSDWNLKPGGIRGGGQFRLIFFSSTKRKPDSTNIADYNTFIRTNAAAGHTGIQPYADGFTVVGCTEAVDARDNTATTFTNANKGVPIYWLKGNKVADNYQDFYNGDWDDEANDKTELGTNGPDTSVGDNYPATGCEDDGTEADFGGTPQALGSSEVRLGNLNQTNSSRNPLSGQGGANPSINRHMYGLSQVFEVIDIPTSNAGTLTDGGTPRTGVLIRGWRRRALQSPSRQPGTRLPDRRQGQRTQPARWYGRQPQDKNVRRQRPSQTVKPANLRSVPGL